MDLALFDFDGTLTTHDTMPDFVRRSVPRSRLFYGQLVLAPLVIGYRAGWVSGTRVRRAVVRMAYRGMPAAALATAGREYAEHTLPHVLRPEAMARLAWHLARGDEVAVVSGGLDVYLAPWCARHGLELLCSSLQQDRGVLTGRYHGEQCVLEEKARRVRARYDLGGFTTIHAYGDTTEDRALLDLASRGWYRGVVFDMTKPVELDAMPDATPTALSVARPAITPAERAMPWASLRRVLLLTGLLLLVPWVAMAFTDEVRWGPGDFGVAALLLASAGGAVVLARHCLRRGWRRWLAIAGVLLAFALVWAELAVGVLD